MKTPRFVVLLLSLLVFLLSFTSETFAAGNAPQPGICTRSCWGARAPNGSFGSISTLQRAIVHHTAAAGHYNTTSQAASAANVRGVQNYHMDSNGWADIGYHFLVDKLGNTFEGLSNSMYGLPRGAHDNWNTNSFGFSCLGYFHTPYNQQPTNELLNALAAVIAWRMPGSWRPYGWPGNSYGTCGNSMGYVDSHRRVRCETSCPGDLVYNYIGSNLNGGWLRDAINQKVSGGQPYDAAFVGQSYPEVMYPGQESTMWIEYTNRGTSTWNYLTRLATSSPRGSTGYLFSGAWLAHDRPCGVGLETGPGGIGRFTLIGKAPTTPGYYVSYWELVQEGTAWFEGLGDDAWFGIEVAKSGDAVQWQAEDYSRGSHAQQNRDYYDTTGGNTGGAYRFQDVDIRNSPEGPVVGWTAPGEWMQYFYYNPAAKNVRWTLRYSNGGGAAVANLTVNGAFVGTLNLPSTGGWDNFVTVSTTLNLSQTGNLSLGIYTNSNGPDYNWFRLDKI